MSGEQLFRLNQLTNLVEKSPTYGLNIDLRLMAKTRWHVDIAIHEDVQVACMLDDLDIHNYRIVHNYLKGLAS